MALRLMWAGLYPSVLIIGCSYHEDLINLFERNNCAGNLPSVWNNTVGNWLERVVNYGIFV